MYSDIHRDFALFTDCRPGCMSTCPEVVGLSQNVDSVIVLGAVVIYLIS